MLARSTSARIVAAVLCLAPIGGGAYETDQFTERLEPLEDSTEALDARVNQSIVDAIADWRGPRNERRVVDAIFHDIGGHHWVDRI